MGGPRGASIWAARNRAARQYASITGEQLYAREGILPVEIKMKGLRGGRIAVYFPPRWRLGWREFWEETDRSCRVPQWRGDACGGPFLECPRCVPLGRRRIAMNQAGFHGMSFQDFEFCLSTA